MRSLLIPRVHEGATAALRSQVWIVDGRAILIGRKATGEKRVGLELRRAAVELARMAQDHSRAAVHGLNDPANLDVGVAVFPQLADFFAIFRKAHDGEAAFVVGVCGEHTSRKRVPSGSSTTS
jgi:hypothetical protein